MKPVIIDAATIFDPARLVAVLSSVDIRYSEIWVSRKYDHFKEKDLITGFGTESRFGLLPNPDGTYKADPLDTPSANDALDPRAWVTGPKILRWALKEGMVVPKDLFKHESLAIDLEKRNHLSGVSESVMLGPAYGNDTGPERAWRLEPYGIGHGLGLIVAAAREEQIDPFLSHPYFSDSVSTHNYSHYVKDSALKELVSNSDGEGKNITIDEVLKVGRNLVSSPEPISMSDVAMYIRHKDRVDAISGIITVSKDLETRKVECGVIVSKYVATTVADAALFAGIPVTSTAMTFYDVAARYLK
jgi:hypothetical protein